MLSKGLCVVKVGFCSSKPQGRDPKQLKNSVNSVRVSTFANSETRYGNVGALGYAHTLW